MWRLFFPKSPTLRQRLTRQLDEAIERRVDTTAKVAYWKAEEAYAKSEITRLTAELAALPSGDDAEAQSTAPDSAEGAGHSR